MSEEIPKSKPELPQEDIIKNAELSREWAIERISSRGETFPFAGIREDAYRKLKAESDKFPGYATDIDKLIKRFKSEGFTIVITGGVNVFAMPALCDSTSSNDIEDNTVPLKFFAITDDMDEDIKVLISALIVLSQK